MENNKTNFSEWYNEIIDIAKNMRTMKYIILPASKIKLL